jgi:hypothetical protein
MSLYWLPSQLTDSMEQSPSSEADSFSSNQEIPHILWYPKIQYRVRSSPPFVPILSQINHGNAFSFPFISSRF